VDEVIDDGDGVALREKKARDSAANVAGSASDQDVLGVRHLITRVSEVEVCGDPKYEGFAALWMKTKDGRRQKQPRQQIQKQVLRVAQDDKFRGCGLF
jgi:hypothetical protein